MTKYYLALKRKKILIFATTWMQLEGIMLSKPINPPKEKYPIFLIGDS